MIRLKKEKACAKAETKIKEIKQSVEALERKAAEKNDKGEIEEAYEYMCQALKIIKEEFF